MGETEYPRNSNSDHSWICESKENNKIIKANIAVFAPETKEELLNRISFACMNKSEKRNLIFWFLNPPNNMARFVTTVAKLWDGKVIVISCHDVTSERAKVGFSRECEGVEKTIILDEEEDKGAFVERFFDDHKDDVFCFGGLHRDPAPYMYRLREKYKASIIVNISEKTAPNMGNFLIRSIKKVIGPIFYRNMLKKAQRCVDIMFVCSLHGLSEFRRYGWKKSNMHNFMYCEGIPTPTVLKPYDGVVRFLYVGRFDYRMRGLDVLMKCFDRVSSKNWTLTLVGGYGDTADEVISWAESRENVIFSGSWNTNEVQKKMQNYDVFICPSRENSWYGQINQALCAGIGVITTDQAGSDELIAASGAGEVIPGSDVDALLASVEKVLLNPQIVDDWKKMAENYAPRISLETVANYFCTIIKNHLSADSQNILCPWTEVK